MLWYGHRLGTVVRVSIDPRIHRRVCRLHLGGESLTSDVAGNLNIVVFVKVKRLELHFGP